MGFKIGEVTLTASYTTSGNLFGTPTVHPYHGQGSATANFEFGLGPLSCSGNASVSGVYVPPLVDGYASVFGVYNYGISVPNAVDPPPQYYGTGTSNLDLSGSASISIPCDIVMDFDNPDGAANLFHAGILDSPGSTRVTFSLIANGDGLVSCSFAGLSASSSTPLQGMTITPAVTALAGVTSATSIVQSPPPPLPDAGAYPGNASLNVSISSNIPAGSIPAFVL
jgi:hypothetical protein